MNEHAHTLFGGKEIPVTFADTRTDTFKVGQFRVKQYQAAFLLIDDEVGLIALATDRPRALIEELAPASYELVYAALLEVNKSGFFIFADRAMKRASGNLATLPPDVLEKFLKSKSASAKQS